MIAKIDRQFFLELLIVLLVINYMVITIILHDFAPLKYSRDLILGIFFCLVIFKNRKIDSKLFWFEIGIFCFLFYGFFTAYSQSLGLLVFRKYAFPLVLLVIASSYNLVVNLERLLRFLACFMSLTAGWGIFQAHILGDSFLRRIGYKVSYSYGYGEDMLSNSFYFGGFGIQRVVSTISNSNVCGLIFGMSLITLIILYDYWNIRYKNFLLIILGSGFVLTFSRSNFLAMGLVTVFSIWPILKQKRKITRYLILFSLFLFSIAVCQGENGVLFKIYKWIDLTLHMSESSSVGRVDVWSDALSGIKQNPLGVGFGHVGTIAISENVQNAFSCESSYLAMALDFGCVGSLFYCIFLLYLAKKNWIIAKKNEKKKNCINAKVARVGVTVVLYYSIVMFFSNHIYDMESMSILFIIVGIALYYPKKNYTQFASEKNFPDKFQ